MKLTTTPPVCPISEQIREQDPLKQGLKLIRESRDQLGFRIREQDPLKQGLKHYQDISASNKSEIREQDPLKQGLKPKFLAECTRAGKYS